MAKKKNIVTKEEYAFNKLRERIEEIEVDPCLKMQNVLESDEYKTLFAGGFGCEVISLYVTPQKEKNSDNLKRKQIEFLFESEHVLGALDFPMFTVNGPRSSEELLGYTDVKEETIKIRRGLQRDLLKSSDKRTSAELCAKYLQIIDAPEFLLLPFGEILAYCYLYHVLEEAIKQSKNSIKNWNSVADNSWEKLIENYEKRPNETDITVRSNFVNALYSWYFDLNKKDCYNREYLKEYIIKPVYTLSDKAKNLLESLHNQVDSQDSLKAFLLEWAKDIYKFIPKSERGNLKQIISDRMLINPTIEEQLWTRGLYVTIIRSPLNRGKVGSSPLSQAYAICTIFDAASLEDKNRRDNLDRTLCRLAHNDLVQYDYNKQVQNVKNHDKIRQLFNTVSSSNDSWEELLQAAGRISLQVSKADHVLVSMRDIGTFLLFKDSNIEKDTHEMYQPAWFGHLSYITSHCNNKDLLKSIKEDGSLVQTDDNQPEHLIKLKEHILKKLKVDLNDNLDVLLLPVGNIGKDSDEIGNKDNNEREGIIILFFKSTESVSLETKNSINQIATALSIGMKMPFRSMIGKGWISLLFGSLSRFRFSIPSPPKVPKLSIQRIIDSAIATMLEITQIGFIAIGLMFLWSVGMVFISIFSTSDTSNIITETLKNVEKMVMAFSICLAATGIMFLIKPEIAFGQPKWMRKFAKPGTLEQTLIKLAALVMTIDVLSVILQLQDSLKNQTPYIWILVKPAMFYLIAYLVVLIGLAFMFEFLFNEKDAKMKRQSFESENEDNELRKPELK